VVYLASQRRVVCLAESQSRANQQDHKVFLAIRNLLVDSLEVTKSQLKLNQVSSEVTLNHQVSLEATRSQLTLSRQVSSEVTRSQLMLNHQVSLEVTRSHLADYLVTLNQLR
jgi:hypothetical protein